MSLSLKIVLITISGAEEKNAEDLLRERQRDPQELLQSKTATSRPANQYDHPA